MLGRYRLVDVLGEGGMGAVWRAHDERMRRDVALKQLKLPPGLDAGQREHLVARMEREARSVGMLKHPNVVTVHDQFHDEDGLPWIVMELVRGRSLAAVIGDEGPLDEARVARIGARIASALAAAHEAGIVHRDIKPANVLLEDERVVVTDFGIAAVAGETTLTASGALVGTPAYLAPEQVNGAEATAASDAWSLGATLYAAVEGRPAFTGGTLAALLLAVSQGRPAPTQHARRLAPVLRELLRRDPARRPTAEAVAATLTALTDSEPAPEPAPAPVPPLFPQPTRRALLVSGAAAVAALSIPIGFVIRRDHRTVSRGPVATPASRLSAGHPLIGHTDSVTAIAFSPDGKTLATASEDGTVRMWDVFTRAPTGNTLVGHSGTVQALAFSPDGKTLATGGDDKTVRRWDAATHAPLGKPFAEHTDSVRAVAYSPDGKTLATAGQLVFLCDANTLKIVGDPLVTSGLVGTLAYSPDGEILITASNDNIVRLWDITDRTPMFRQLKGDTNAVGAVAFSPDGKTLATAGHAWAVSLWNMRTRVPIGKPLVSRDAVGAVAFSPDGKTLATAGEDKSVRLWDAHARTPLGKSLTGHTGAITALAFSPDGRTLASASDDRTARLWDVTSTPRPTGNGG